MRFTHEPNQMCLELSSPGNSKDTAPGDSTQRFSLKKRVTEYTEQDEADYEALLNSLQPAPPWVVDQEGITAIIAPLGKVKESMAIQSRIMQMQIREEETARKRKCLLEGISPLDHEESWISTKRRLAFWLARFAGIKTPRYKGVTPMFGTAD